jgi:hypothetical protein
MEWFAWMVSNELASGGGPLEGFAGRVPVGGPMEGVTRSGSLLGGYEVFL